MAQEGAYGGVAVSKTGPEGPAGLEETKTGGEEYSNQMQQYKLKDTEGLNGTAQLRFRKHLEQAYLTCSPPLAGPHWQATYVLGYL